MLGNFSYCNPTKLYFGDDSLLFCIYTFECIHILEQVDLWYIFFHHIGL